METYVLGQRRGKFPLLLCLVTTVNDILTLKSEWCEGRTPYMENMKF